MMRRLLLFYCLLFGAVSAALAQQGFRVSVLNDAQEPLIGAYIYVNDKAVAATDTLGRAVIPQDTLKIGDSISVSYIFAKDQSVVVDQVMLIKGEYEFILEETHGALLADEVVVTAKIKRLYRKSLPIKRHLPYSLYGLYNTHFTMNITNPGDSLPSHWVAGRLEGLYTSLHIISQIFSTRYNSVSAHSRNPDPTVLDSLRKYGFHVGFVNGYPLEITTNDDTTGLEYALKYFLPRALQANHISLQRVYTPEPHYKELELYPKAKVNYGYLGKDQDASTFRLIYSGHGVGNTHQIEVRIDADDKFDRDIVETSLNFEDTINGNSYYVKAKVREKNIYEHLCGGVYIQGVYHNFTKSWVSLVPYVLEYYIKGSDGSVVNITMSNVNISSLFERMKFPFSAYYIQNWPRLKSKQDYLHFYYDECNRYLERMVQDKERAKEKQQRKIEKVKLKSSHIN